MNEHLSEYRGSSLAGVAQNATLLHTLQRHWDILQDYSHEFQKIKANVSANREREDLLGSVHKDIEYVGISMPSPTLCLFVEFCKIFILCTRFS